MAAINVSFLSKEFHWIVLQMGLKLGCSCATTYIQLNQIVMKTVYKYSLYILCLERDAFVRLSGLFNANNPLYFVVYICNLMLI